MKTPVKRKDREEHLHLAVFVVRNRLAQFNPRKERDCFEPTGEMDWNDKTQAGFDSL